MQFSVKSSAIPALTTSCLVLGLYEDGNLSPAGAEADAACRKALSKVISNGDIKGKTGASLLLQKVEGLKAKRVLLVGLGKEKGFDAIRYSTALKLSCQALEKYHIDEAVITLTALEPGIDAERRAAMLASTAETNSYRYSTTRSKRDTRRSLARLHAWSPERTEAAAMRKGLATGQAVGRGMNTARELGNLPGNICTPTYLGEQAVALGKKYSKLKVRVLSEAQMKRLGMDSLLSVGNGSEQPSALIVMEYKGSKAATKPNVIVGKGITFDTGGISLKPGAGMDEMKFDMCGAASVMGSMQALCELDAAVNVVGVIASAENMPSGRATKPGDVVTSMSGQTIEILNTDAEGRLVLCDALTYVERFKPKSVIDIATLTGACIVALGNEVSGLMSNDDDLAKTLYDCGQNTLDWCWQLPIWDLYQKQLDSNFADMGNIGGKGAGTITAACFLSRFARKYKWAHLDIAGSAWLQGAQKGATGRPVPLLMDYLLNN